MGVSLLCTGAIVQSRAHFDRAIALYDPIEHRSLATQFGQDSEVSVLCYRSWALWMLGHPEAALADASRALNNARAIDQAPTLMHALFHVSLPHIYCGDYTTANTLINELVALAEEKNTVFWKALGMLVRGWLSSVTGNAADAVQMITSGIAAWQSTGSTLFVPFYLSHLASAYAQLDQFENARACIGEATIAMQTAKQLWCEAEVHRIAGEIALQSPEPDAAKAQACFERALAVAREQRAKSWELRAATSLARLWRDQGKRDKAGELLAPVYGWFTEGNDRSDQRQAKALLDALPA
jgi:predicted ATPase